MKKQNNYWVHKNNNRWDSEIYSKEEALKLSKTLINCFNCYDCSNCSDCSDCFKCFKCFECSDCYHCSDCSEKKN